LKILITGATGLIGNKLGETLVRQGFEIFVVSRNKQNAIENLHFAAQVIECDLNYSTFDFPIDVETVIHLAGDNLGEGLWTKEKKEVILSSRVKTSENLIQSILNKSKDSSIKLKKIISASAIGIYPYSKSEEFTETATVGDHFLADVCKKWEDVFNQAEKKMNQVAFLKARIGVVLSSEGGLLEQLIPIFKLGLASNLASGRQWLSWIDIDDLVSAFLFLITYKAQSKIFNFVSPNPVTNSEFTIKLASRLNAKLILPSVPEFVLKTILGDKSVLAIGSQKVKPESLLKEGFQFKYAAITSSIENQISEDWKKYVVYKSKQFINKPVELVFSFFSDAKNLQQITPKTLDFKILSQSSDPVQKGTVIEYKLKIHGVPVNWRTKILEYEKNVKFIDNQERGPYSVWHHTHFFEKIQSGTLMTDRVLYRLPMGWFGYFVAGWYVKLDVAKIFQFRRKSLKSFFTNE